LAGSTAVTIGDAEIISVSDADRITPLSRLFPDVPAEAWTGWRDKHPAALPPGSRLGDEWVNNFGMFIVRTPRRSVVVDLGVGPGPVARLGGVTGSLEAALDRHGLAAGDVDTVVITHLHVDHVGWAFEDGGSERPRFANAVHLLHRLDWEWFCDPGSEGYAEDMHAIAEPLARQRALTLIDGESHPVGDGMTLVHTPGHTPGHLSLLVESGEDLAILGGDVMHHPAQVTHPDWCLRIDVDKQTGREQRERLLDEAATRGALVACGHLPPPSMGRIDRVDGQPSWRPVE
jgi:glyoxylase-like metal-dependent hydrolase (beta-lactamase superfamily II)